VAVYRPTPNRETVAALLDITWRMSSFEANRTESLDRKASTLAGFASLVLSLVTTLGRSFVERFPGSWAVALFLAGIFFLVLAIAVSIVALLPKERETLTMGHLERFPLWSTILEPPEVAQGETMRGLIKAIAGERTRNDAKGRQVRWAFQLLVVGLLCVNVEAAILGARAL
jgi:hypothetical protein